MAVHIGPFDHIGSILDNNLTALLDPKTITTAKIGGSLFVYVGSSGEDGITVFKFDISEPALLAWQQTVLDTSASRLHDPSSLTTVYAGGNPFLIAASPADDALNVYSIGTGVSNLGELTFKDQVTSSALLDGIKNFAVIEYGRQTLVAASGANRLTLYELSASGQLSKIQSIGDSATMPLREVTCIKSFQSPSGIDLLVTSSVEDGVGLWKFNAAGKLILLDQEADLPGESAGPAQVELFNAGGRYFVYTGRISADGALAYEIVDSELVPVVLDVVGGGNPVLGTGGSVIGTLTIEGVSFLTLRTVLGEVIFSAGADGTLTVEQAINLGSAGSVQSNTGGAFTEYEGYGFLFEAGFNQGFQSGVSTLMFGGSFGSASGEIIFGTNGEDQIVLLGNNDAADGKDGKDRIYGGAGNDDLFGGGGGDYLSGGAGNDELLGGTGADTLHGGEGADELDGGSSDDVADYRLSDAAVDVWLGSSGPQSGGHAEGDTLISMEDLAGSAFDDILLGGGTANLIAGYNGNDFIKSGGGDDRLFGGLGDDELDGDVAHDKLFGDDGDDTLRGDTGNDQLFGGDGDDLMLGGAGNDRITIDSPSDLASGGSGFDRFIISSKLAEGDVKVAKIYDFNSADDTVSLLPFIEFTSFADVIDAMANLGATSSKLTFGNGSILIFNGIQVAQFTADDFLLA